MAAAADGEADMVRVPCARALYSFQGQAEHELDFGAGVSIQLLRRIDENWLEGKLNGKIGIFPASHVKIEVSSPSVVYENTVLSSGKPYAIALHSFHDTQTGDLSFNKGDLIELLGDLNQSAWMKGRLGSITGIFPATFVEVLRYPEEGVDCTSSHDLSGSVTKQLPKPRPSLTESHPLNMTEAICTMKETNSFPSSPAPSSPLPPHQRENYTQETPLCSEPAPPCSTLIPHASSHVTPPCNKKCRTLPHPAPQRTTTKHPSSTLSSSFSASSSSSNQLQSELAIERNLLESTEGLLVTRQQQSGGQREKLQLAVDHHYENIAQLTTQIEEVNKAWTKDGTGSAMPILPPPRSKPPVPSKEQQRLKVINELILTERDFHCQMEICVTRLLPALKQVEGVLVDDLFGNLEEVSELSWQFLTALEHSISENKQARVGHIFTTFAPRMKSVYGKYCHNYDAASSLNEKYLEVPAMVKAIQNCVDLVRSEVCVWDLQSILIKPAQRVLKYPLLLSQLLKHTGSCHPDYRDIHTAHMAVGKMAQDINEIKRRKDLVVKYTAAKEERKGSMSFHSLQKKMQRWQQSLTQIAGFRQKTVDPKFDDLEQKVVSMYTLVHRLVYNIAAWQDKLQCVNESRLSLAESMSLFCSTPFLTSYKACLPQLQDAMMTQAKFVKDHVSTPLESLEGLFQNPLNLIQKRKDKLLDFDRLQYVMDHTVDLEKIPQMREELLLAKRTYEALNVQLLEELPQFLQAVTSMLEHLLRVLLQTQQSLTSTMSSQLKLLCTSSEKSNRVVSASSSADLQQSHADQLTTLCKDLTKLSMVPASLTLNYSLHATRVSQARKISEPSREDMLTFAPHQEILADNTVNSTMEEEKVDRDVSAEGTSIQVMFNFSAQNSSELSVVAGQIVRLLCAHDRLGCKDWWLVQDLEQHTQGYIPATYLSAPLFEDDS